MAKFTLSEGQMPLGAVLHSLNKQCNSISEHCIIIQKLNYRKQIARQLRIQYVEGIYRPEYYTVTLKSRLRITQGHWKRNHWIDHT